MKMRFSLSSTYHPSPLMTDMFIQHGMEAVCSDSTPPASLTGYPHGRGYGEQSCTSTQLKAEGTTGGWPHVVPFRGHEGRAKTEKGCCDKRRVPACLSNLSSVFRTQ